MSRPESSKPAFGKKKNLGKRGTVPLAEKLDKNLVSYALAAGAATVGVMALTQAAEARVIATPANIAVPINGGLVQFDINRDGVPDFGLSATTFAQTFASGAKRQPGPPPLGGIFGGKLNAVPAQTANEVALNGMYGTKPCAAAMAAGARIGPSLPFGAGNVLMAGIFGTGCAGSSFAYCNWKGSHPPHAFLAVKFTDTAGSVHFGWVRITVQQSLTTHFNATITGYAYETVPNMPIFAGSTRGPVSDATPIDPGILAPRAPEVASLGRLALGAQGLSAWRRQEEEEEAA